MATSSTHEVRLVPVEAASDAVTHAVWLDGPSVTAERIGARGYAYAPYTHEGAPVAIEPHVVILYTGGITTIARTIGDVVEQEEVGPGDLSMQSNGTPAVWGWAKAIDVLHVYISPAHLRTMARCAFDPHVSSVRLRNVLRAPDPMLVQLGFDLIRELEHPTAPGADLAARAIGERLLIQLLRCHAELEHGCDSFDDETSVRLKAHIEHHLDGRLDLAELARVAGYGVHHFCKLFRATFGQSPHDYVLERRIAAARQLLATTSSGISEVAMACGFADQSHLTRCFKRHFGVPPARWRRAMT